jgi:hypothetical protein
MKEEKRREEKGKDKETLHASLQISVSKISLRN